MKNRKLLVLIVSMIAAAILINVLTGMGDKEKAACVKKEKSRSHTMTQDITWFFSSMFDRFSDPQKTAIHKENYIRDVVLEKKTACVGEDVEVYVDAANPGGIDSNLYYQVGTETGNPAVVRFDEEGRKTFNVLVKDFTGTGLDTKEVTIDVVSCGERASVEFESRYSGKNQEILDFEVTGSEGLSGGCRYSWDFGDGKTASSYGKLVSHDYRGRKYDRYISSFIVTVIARDSNGKTAQARKTVSIPNIHYISNQMGNPTIPVKYDRFPGRRGKSYQAEATLYNIYNEDILLTDATVRFTSCNSGSKVIENDAGISSLLKRSDIPAGGSMTDTISLDESLVPASTCVVGIEFRGTLGNDKNVKAEMYLDIVPSDGAVSANDKEVVDEAMVEKLNRAESILGKGKPITPDDLERLEREGKL